MFRRATLLIILPLLAGIPAVNAQETLPLPRSTLRHGASTVQSGLTLSLPLDKDRDRGEQQQEILRSFYSFAEKSCALVIATIAETCQVSNVTTTTRIEDRSERVPQLTLTGQVMMSVSFKPAIGSSEQP